MWLLANETPFAAERSWTRDERGAEVWLVAIKATFAIMPDGRQVAARAQAPVNMAPVYAADGDELLDDTDFNLAKPRTDVLVAGQAHAPDGRPATESLLRLKVADIDKRVRVTGDRVFVPGPVSTVTSRPDPFLALPLTWRRAHGGRGGTKARPDWDRRNPVGTGFATDAAHLVGKSAPNFAYEIAANNRPAGFGPVAYHWLPRASHAGTYGPEWETKRDPLRPSDFSHLYFQCAPEDQQTAAPLSGHEMVQLGGFTPDGFLRFVLPRLRFEIETAFYKRPSRRHDEPALHTLRILPDERRFSVTWLSALSCPYDEERLKGTTVRLLPPEPMPAALSRAGVWSG